MGEHFSSQEFAGRPPRKVLTDAEYLNKHIRHMLAGYQEQLTENERVMRTSVDPLECQKARVAARRNERSIATWTAKLLCQHNPERKSVMIGGHHTPSLNVRCSICKTQKARAV